MGKHTEPEEKSLKKDKKLKDKKKEKKERKEKKDKKDKKDKKKSRKDESQSEEEVMVEETKAEPVKVVVVEEWRPKQLFVSGIPYNATKDGLIEFFGEEHKTSINEVKMPLFQDSGKCIGYAHVNFTTKAGYENALTKNGQSLGGRYLDIKEPHGQ